MEVIFAVSILTGSCTKDFVPRQQSFPLIQTTAVTHIDDQGAQFNGQLIKTGTDPVLDFGFKYVERPDSLFKTVPDTFSVSIAGEFTNKFSIKVNHNLNIYLKYNVMAYAVTARETVIGNAVIFKSASTSPIQITSFSPNKVLDGDTLTILGENFNRYGPDNVFIGDKLQLNVLEYNNKLITVPVPPISHTGPIDVIVDAYYSKTNSNGLTAIGPSITSFFPAHGPAGEEITLDGRFSSNINYNRVFFNGVEATVSKSSKNQITVYLPSGLSGNVSVTINVNGKTFTSLDAFLVE
jgi:hypothetical protein